MNSHWHGCPSCSGRWYCPDIAHPDFPCDKVRMTRCPWCIALASGREGSPLPPHMHPHEQCDVCLKYQQGQRDRANGRPVN